MIKHVQQLNSSGCGPACAAMIADIPYELALAIMWPGRRRGFFSSYADVRRVLRALDVTCST